MSPSDSFRICTSNAPQEETGILVEYNFVSLHIANYGDREVSEEDGDFPDDCETLLLATRDGRLILAALAGFLNRPTTPSVRSLPAIL